MSKKGKYIPHVDNTKDYKTKENLKIINKKYLTIRYHDDAKHNDMLPAYLKEIAIDKRAFINQLDNTTHYINYFIDYFDPDNELLTAYIAMMFAITRKDVDYDMDIFIDNIVQYIGSETMVKKIALMVDYNIDESMVEPPKTAAGKKKAKEADPSLQLTLDHLKAILGIAIAHKMCIPMISAYYKCRSEYIEIEEKSFYFKCFASLIFLFDEVYDVNMYNKLGHTATTRVSKTEKKDSAMWDRRKRMGVTPTSYTNKLMKDLFVDLSQKTIFSKSAIKFIHVCFDTSIKYELMQQDPCEFTDMKMDMSESDDDLTKFDKLQINNARMNTKKLSRANAAINDLIQRMSTKHKIDIDDETVAFYIKHLSFIETQLNLVFLYYSPILGHETMQYVKPNEFVKLTIIMKEMLVRLNFIYLPHLLTGRFDQAKSKRFNKKRLEKYISNHPNYDDLMEEYSHAKDCLNKEKIYNQIRDLMQACYIVDHKLPDQLDTYIEPDKSEEIVIDEIIRFIAMI